MVADDRVAVITVTRNAAGEIENLGRSLQSQTDDGFVWVVQDASSTDGTVEVVKGLFGDQVSLEVVDDFSIYDGLNRAIKRIGAEYYLVVGADDELSPQAIANFRQEVRENDADIVSALVATDNGTVGLQHGLGWLRGMVGMASSHSVGLLIRRSLHARFGYYSNRFPIVADQLFVKSAIRGGASLHRAAFLAGSYSSGGFSGQNELQFICEFFQMQMQTEKSKAVQVALFGARLLRYVVKRGASGQL